MKIAIVIGSVRPNRRGEAVGRWVHELAGKRTDATYELIDLRDYDLPMLDEPSPPSSGKYTKDHTRRWAAKVAEYDGYVFVTPEYNHGTCASLKNALDFCYAEWANKPAGFVGYGDVGGVRAIEQLRLVLVELTMASVRHQVSLMLREDWENYAAFKPRPFHAKLVTRMLDALVSWATAFKTLR